MSIEEIIAKGYGHFLANCTGSIMMSTVYRHYAKEELALPDSEIPAFIVRANFADRSEPKGPEYNRFYTWYYFNYMTGNISGVKYTTELTDQEIGEFYGTKIWPVKMQVVKESFECVPCDPDEAAFWSVFILLPNGRSVAVADCTDQEAAQTAELFIHRIAKHFKLQK